MGGWWSGNSSLSDVIREKQAQEEEEQRRKEREAMAAIAIQRAQERASQQRPAAPVVVPVVAKPKVSLPPRVAVDIPGPYASPRMDTSTPQLSNTQTYEQPQVIQQDEAEPSNGPRRIPFLAPRPILPGINQQYNTPKTEPDPWTPLSGYGKAETPEPVPSVSDRVRNPYNAPMQTMADVLRNNYQAPLRPLLPVQAQGPAARTPLQQSIGGAINQGVGAVQQGWNDYQNWYDQAGKDLTGTLNKYMNPIADTINSQPANMYEAQKREDRANYVSPSTIYEGINKAIEEPPFGVNPSSSLSIGGPAIAGIWGIGDALLNGNPLARQAVEGGQNLLGYMFGQYKSAVEAPVIPLGEPGNASLSDVYGPMGEQLSHDLNPFSPNYGGPVNAAWVLYSMLLGGGKSHLIQAAQEHLPQSQAARERVKKAIDQSGDKQLNMALANIWGGDTLNRIDNTITLMQTRDQQVEQLHQQAVQMQYTQPDEAAKLFDQADKLKKMSYADMVDKYADPAAELAWGLVDPSQELLFSPFAHALGLIPEIRFLKRAKKATTATESMVSELSQIAGRGQRLADALAEGSKEAGKVYQDIIDPYKTAGEKFVDSPFGRWTLQRPTIGAKVYLDSEITSQGLMGVVAGMTDKQDVLKVIDALANDPTQLHTGIYGMSQDAISKFGQADGAVRWGPGLIAPNDFTRRAGIFKTVENELKNMESLRGTGMFNPSELQAEAHGILSEGATRMYGGRQPRSLPFGAETVKVERTGTDSALLAYRDAQGKVVKRSKEMTLPAAAQALVDVQNAQKGKAGSVYGAAKFLLADLQRYIMNDVWLFTRPAYAVGNGLSASTLLLAHDALGADSLKTIQEWNARIFGGFQPTTRMADTLPGVESGIRTMKQEIGGSAIGGIAAGISKLTTGKWENPVSKFMRDLQGVPLGKTEVYVPGIGTVSIGEEALAAKANYYPAKRAFEGAVTDRATAVLKPQIAQTLDPKKGEMVFNKMVDIAQTEGKSGFMPKLREWLAKPTTKRTLTEMGIPKGILPEETARAIEELLGNSGPEDIASVNEELTRIFHEGRNQPASMLAIDGGQPNVDWTEASITDHASWAADKMVEDGIKAGMAPQDAKQQAEAVITKMLQAQKEGATRIMQDLGASAQSPEAWDVVTDFFLDIMKEKEKARRFGDEAGRIARDLGTPEAWENSWRAKSNVWGAFPAKHDQLAQEARLSLQKVHSGEEYILRHNELNTLDKYLAYDEQEFKRLRAIDLGGIEEDSGIFQEVIDANRQMNDNAAYKMLESFRRNPTLDNFDIVHKTMQMVDAQGAKTAFELSQARKALAVGDMSSLDYEKLRNQKWNAFFDHAVEFQEQTSKVIVRNGLAKEALAEAKGTEGVVKAGKEADLDKAADAILEEISASAPEHLRPQAQTPEMVPGDYDLHGGDLPYNPDFDTPTGGTSADRLRRARPTISTEGRGAYEQHRSDRLMREMNERGEPTVRQLTGPKGGGTNGRGPRVWIGDNGPEARRAQDAEALRHWEESGASSHIPEPLPKGVTIEDGESENETLRNLEMYGNPYGEPPPGWRAGDPVPGDWSRLSPAERAEAERANLEDWPDTPTNPGEITADYTVGSGKYSTPAIDTPKTGYNEPVGLGRKRGYGAEEADLTRGRKTGYGADTPIPSDNELRKIASDNGISTVGDKGKPSDRHLIGSINKRTGSNIKRLSDLSDEQRILAADALRGRGAEKAALAAKPAAVPDAETLNMFGDTAEDLPTISGMAPRVKEKGAFVPQDATRTESMFDLRPEMGKKEPSYKPKTPKENVYTIGHQAKAEMGGMEDARMSMRKEWDRVATGEHGLPKLDQLIARFKRGGSVNLNLDKGEIKMFEDLYGSVIDGQKMENLDDVERFLNQYSGLKNQIDKGASTVANSKQYARMNAATILEQPGVKDELLAADYSEEEIAKLAKDRIGLLDTLATIRGEDPGEFGIHRYESRVPAYSPYTGAKTKDEGYNFWNNFLHHSKASGNNNTLQVADAARAQIRDLNDVEKTLKKGLAEILQGSPNELTGAEKLAVIDMAQDFIPELDNATSVARRVGMEMADHIMFNVNNRKDMDTVMGLLMPYSYFWRNMPSRLVQGAMTKPSLVNFFYKTKRAIELENEQAGVPDKLRGTLPIPGTDKRINVGAVLNYAMGGLPGYFRDDPFDNSEPSDNRVENVTKGWEKNGGPGLFEWVHLAADLADGKIDKDYSAVMNNLAPIPFTGIPVNTGYQAIFGKMPQSGNPANLGFGPNKYDMGRAQDATKRIGEKENLDPALVGYANQVIANQSAGREWNYGVPPQYIGAAVALAERGVRAGAQETMLNKTTSYLSLAGVKTWSDEEKAQTQANDAYWASGYSAENPDGSKALQVADVDSNPTLQRAWTKGDTPGIKTWESSLYDQINQLEKDKKAAEAAAMTGAATAYATAGELTALRKAAGLPYQAKIDVLYSSIDNLKKQEAPKDGLNTDYRSPKEKEAERVEEILKAANKLEGNPGQLSPEATADEKSTFYDSLDQYTQKKHDVVIAELTKPIVSEADRLTGRVQYTPAQAEKMWTDYQNRNMSEMEIDRRKQLADDQKIIDANQAYYDIPDDDYTAKKAYLAAHRDFAAVVGERQAHKYGEEPYWAAELGMDFSEAAKSYRPGGASELGGGGGGNIFEKMAGGDGEEGAHNWYKEKSEYYALPEGSAERDQYLLAHPDFAKAEAERIEKKYGNTPYWYTRLFGEGGDAGGGGGGGGHAWAKEKGEYYGIPSTDHAGRDKYLLAHPEFAKAEAERLKAKYGNTPYWYTRLFGGGGSGGGGGYSRRGGGGGSAWAQEKGEYYGIPAEDYQGRNQYMLDHPDFAQAEAERIKAKYGNYPAWYGKLFGVDGASATGDFTKEWDEYHALEGDAKRQYLIDHPEFADAYLAYAKTQDPTATAWWLEDSGAAGTGRAPFVPYSYGGGGGGHSGISGFDPAHFHGLAVNPQQMNRELWNSPQQAQRAWIPYSNPQPEWLRAGEQLQPDRPQRWQPPRWS